MQLFISKKATEDQRKAIVNIFMCRAKGEGPFVVFADTVKYVLDPQFADIEVKIYGRIAASRFLAFLMSRSRASKTSDWRRAGHKNPDARGLYLEGRRRGKEQGDAHPDAELQL